MDLGLSLLVATVLLFVILDRTGFGLDLKDKNLMQPIKSRQQKLRSLVEGPKF